MAIKLNKATTCSTKKYIYVYRDTLYAYELKPFNALDVHYALISMSLQAHIDSINPFFLSSHYIFYEMNSEFIALHYNILISTRVQGQHNLLSAAL